MYHSGSGGCSSRFNDLRAMDNDLRETPPAPPPSGDCAVRTSQRCQASISHSAIRFALLGPTETPTDAQTEAGRERPGCVAPTDSPAAKFRNEKSSGNDNDTLARSLSCLSAMQEIGNLQE